jgi:uncharacterized membrane protein YdjX (TVP38/TMEM64 family)
VRLVVFAAVVLGLFYLVAVVRVINVEQVRSAVAATGPAAPLVYVVVSAVLGAAFVPGPLLAAGSGVLFGPVLGTFVTLGATVGSATIAGLIGRRAGRESARALLGTQRADRLDAQIQRRGLWAVVGQRFIPGISDALASYTFGAFGVPLWQMAIGAFIGSAPRAFVYTALGASIGDLSSPLAYSAVAVWCVTAIIGAVAAHRGYRQWRGRAGRRTSKQQCVRPSCDHAYMSGDWFESLTGFREESYERTRSRLVVEGDELVSTVNDKRYGIGTLEVPTLAELRSRIEIPTGQRNTVRCVTGEARSMHADPELEGALFQVASQFNLLEMAGPSVTPEDGVTRYSSDHTQGPACAIAAGAATIYRNYFAAVDGASGQTRDRQIDGLESLGEALSAKLGRQVSELWEMRNGYALCTVDGLAAISRLLKECGEEMRDELRGQLAIGVHRDVEVTDVREGPRRLVWQAFCSGLPVAYGDGRRSAWEAFGHLVLEATYEATLLTAVERSHAGGSNIVLLTRVGGGVFGNADEWIDDAIVRALSIVENAGLDIKLVSYGQVHQSFRAIAERFDG